jgi:uncharacterized tellurite resistance protein B-like protein
VDIEESRKIVALLEGVVAADGVVTGTERDFLRRVIDRLGLPYDASSRDPEAAGAPSVGRTTEMLRGFPPDVQARVMALLVEGAIVDGVVAPEERALLLASAASLGIEATALEERIARRLASNVP